MKTLLTAFALVAALCLSSLDAWRPVDRAFSSTHASVVVADGKRGGGDTMI